jgi:hypothetical protein
VNVSQLATAARSESGFVKLRQVPFTEVTIADSFWAPQRETNRVASIPVNLENLEKAKNLENLRLAARGETKGYTGTVFMDSDVAWDDRTACEMLVWLPAGP